MIDTANTNPVTIEDQAMTTPPVDPPKPPDDSNGGDGNTPDGGGNVIDLPIDRELQDSYLTYAMSTIMDRALPDVRDGLKPSQRRILVAMNDLNLGPRAKHRKCAKICGDVSGNYHPHGEGVVYPTLVRFGQDWVMRVPLVNKQGNFGSIDGDPPAAMRYTEARMGEAAADLLEDLKLDTVDYKSNYDDTRLEPTVLPSKFPNLLVNGSTGIAVGMACSIPPHNLTEVCLAIEAIVDNPDLPFEHLMEIIPGPDFPTGGIICGSGGAKRAYKTGRGKLALRGKLHIEIAKNNRTCLIIDEIPYQLVQNTLMERIIDAVKNQRINDIYNIRNESGRKNRTRIVIELKKGADPVVVENQLYKYTPFQSTVSVINIALVNHQPRTLSLRAIIDAYIDHRADVIRRRTYYRLREARKKAHILEGLIYAVCDIDEVIALIRASSTRDEAISQLMQRHFQIPSDHPAAPRIPARMMRLATRDGGIALSRVQAEAIGRMQLIQLVGLEIERLIHDYQKLVDQIEGFEAILADHRLVLDIIREDIIEIREKYGTPRLTDIGPPLDDFDIDDLIPVEDMIVTISHQGYIKRVPIDTYQEQRRGGRGIKGSTAATEEDFTEHLFVASTHDDLLCFTDTGRVFKIKVYRIPATSRTAKGRAIVNLIELKPGERIQAFRAVQDFEKGEDYLTFATTKGIVKRTALKDYRNVNRSGIKAITLRDGDNLLGVIQTTGDDHILLATASGMAIRFAESDVRVMGRNAGGVKGISLKEGDKVVGLVLADDECDLLSVTEHGYGKRTSMSEYLVNSSDADTQPRAQSRGGKGRIDIRTSKRNGNTVAARAVRPDESLVFISQGGMVVRISADSISKIGRATQGVRVVNLKNEDYLIAVGKIEETVDEETENVETPNATESTEGANDAEEA